MPPTYLRRSLTQIKLAPPFFSLKKFFLKVAKTGFLISTWKHELFGIFAKYLTENFCFFSGN